MNPMLRIRKEVFDITQTEMAAIAGVRQATISRWEMAQGGPTRREMEKIRAEAMKRGLDWDDSLFFAANSGAGATA